MSALQVEQWTDLKDLRIGSFGWTTSRSSKGAHLRVFPFFGMHRARLEKKLLKLTVYVTREEDLAVLWTITQPCIEDYRIRLCPLHQQQVETEKIDSCSIKDILFYS